MWFPDVRAVFFDAVGTLIHPEPAAGLVYAAVGRARGSRLTSDEISARFRRAFAHEERVDAEHGLRTAERRETERWRRIVAAVLDDVADRDGCFEELFEHFARPDSWACDPEAERVLGELARGGLTVGLASNYDHRLHRVLAGLPELDPLDHVAISAEIGWRKPASEFFAALRRSTGLPPEQILFVGDDRRNDYEGALAAGLRAVLFDPKGRAPDVPCRIERLEELKPASVTFLRKGPSQRGA
jgi:putative hydrolase of the HAD superfamily